MRLGGSGFDPLDARQDARCLFGSETLTPATVRSGRVAECMSPPSSGAGAGLVALKLTLNGEEFATFAEGHFAYYVQPVLAQLQPPAGPPLGGRLITVAALGLDAFGETKDARCKFGDVSSVAHIKTASALVCAAPPHAAGTVNVTVSLNGADYAGEHLTFEYLCSGYTLIQDCVLDSSCGFCGLEHAGSCLPCAARGHCEDGAAGEPCEAGWSYARELHLQQFAPLESNGSVEADAFHFLRLRCVSCSLEPVAPMAAVPTSPHAAAPPTASTHHVPCRLDAHPPARLRVSFQSRAGAVTVLSQSGAHEIDEMQFSSVHSSRPVTVDLPSARAAGCEDSDTCAPHLAAHPTRRRPLIRRPARLAQERHGRPPRAERARPRVTNVQQRASTVLKHT